MLIGVKETVGNSAALAMRMMLLNAKAICSKLSSIWLPVGIDAGSSDDRDKFI
jgi:hypothetical protein